MTKKRKGAKEKDLRKIANDRIKDRKEKENIDDATRRISPGKGKKLRKKL